MKEIECPLCKGKGKLVVKREVKPSLTRILGEIKCPLCSGRGVLLELEDTDMVDVEFLAPEHIVIHGEGSVNPKYKIETTTLGRAMEKYGDMTVDFCRHCFGAYIVYRDRLIETT